MLILTRNDHSKMRSGWLSGDPLRLRRIAERLMQKAKARDLASIHEFIDRLDGKAVQVIDRGDVPITELSDCELQAIASGVWHQRMLNAKALPAPQKREG